MNTTFRNLKTEEKINDINIDMALMKKDLDNIKTDITEVKESFKEFKNDFNHFIQKFESDLKKEYVTKSDLKTELKYTNRVINGILAVASFIIITVVGALMSGIFKK